MDTTNPGSADAPGWFRTRSLEQAIHRCEIAFHPHRLRLLGRPEEFGYTQRRTQAGPITVAHLSYDSDVWLDFGDSRDSYYIHIPLSGHLESRYRGQELIATPSLASVYGPAADITVTRWPAGSRHLGVKIDQLALDSALERLLGRSVDSPVEFGATLPVRPGAVQSWVRQLLWMSGELAYPGNPMRQSAALDPLVESVIYGFILMADHAYRESLARPAEPVRPAAVRDAMDIIEAAPQASLTTAHLAAQCHVSVRALQEGFRRHLGMTPTSYVRMTRLRRAHRDLRAAHAAHASVAPIAHRWGFSHLGRFAVAYKAMYGETPLQTLRGGTA
jgi:AraC-like DNA-binding protein